MHIEQLIIMANDIATFFQGAVDRSEAVQSVATHLRRYWDPRMRKQIIECYQAGETDLSELARAAVAALIIEADAV